MWTSRAIRRKIQAIELIDSQVLGTLIEGLEGKEDYRIMVLPDHPTPLATRTHSNDAVPFFIYDSRHPQLQSPDAVYTEEYVKNGLIVNDGHKLMDMLLEANTK